MPAYGLTIYKADDKTDATAGAAQEQIAAVLGVCTDEQLAVVLIEALVGIHADADQTAGIVALQRGPLVGGTELQIWNMPGTLVAAADWVFQPVRFFDYPGIAADVEYSIALQCSGASSPVTYVVYGFTATVFPGGGTLLPNND